MRAVVLRVLGLLVVLQGVSSSVAASSVTVVPEISPTSVSAGLAILAGGVLMLRARRRGK
jgi:hypothetical protein